MLNINITSEKLRRNAVAQQTANRVHMPKNECLLRSAKAIPEDPTEERRGGPQRAPNHITNATGPSPDDVAQTPTCEQGSGLQIPRGRVAAGAVPGLSPLAALQLVAEVTNDLIHRPAKREECSPLPLPGPPRVR